MGCNHRKKLQDYYFIDAALYMNISLNIEAFKFITVGKRRRNPKYYITQNDQNGSLRHTEIA